LCLCVWVCACEECINLNLIEREREGVWGIHYSGTARVPASIYTACADIIVDPWDTMRFVNYSNTYESMLLQLIA
jgi:hypothetical protein